MSFMPSPGSVVRLGDGTIAIVTQVSPSGNDDLVWDGQRERWIDAFEIAEIIHEVE